MTNLEQLDIAIVEALWGMKYEEAMKNELELDGCLTYFQDKDNLEESHVYMTNSLALVCISGDNYLDGAVLEEARESDECFCEIKGIPNTIGRVMAALHMIRTPEAPFNIGDDGTLVRTHFTADGLKCDDICKWEDLVKGTTKDQSPETIEKLLTLFKK